MPSSTGQQGGKGFRAWQCFSEKSHLGTKPQIVNNFQQVAYRLHTSSRILQVYLTSQSQCVTDLLDPEIWTGVRLDLALSILQSWFLDLVL
jgi:hypothetical protein